MKLALDAGHYINTPGKRTPDDIREWTLNNEVVVAIQNELSKYKVDVVRLDDPTGKNEVTLSQRMVKAKGCDVLLSVHHNAYQSKWGEHTGTETLVQDKKADNVNYATAMNNAIVNTLGIRNRGVKVQDTHVLREFKGGPACLVEVGFMDSTIDHPIITNKANSHKVGVALAKAFVQYFNVSLKDSTTPTPTPKPEVKIFKVGDKVKIKSTAKAYATGEVIPTRYKGYVDTIQQVKADRVLLKSLVSWVYTNDVELVTNAPTPAPAPKPKPTAAISKGDRVTYEGYVYRDSAGNGKGVKVSGTFTATIVNDNTYGVHIDNIGWAKKSDVKKVGATAPGPIKVGDKVTVVNNVQYNGGRFAVHHENYDVYEVKGDRVVIGNTNRGKKVITAAVNVINLRKV